MDAALQGRLAKLRTLGDCCSDLGAVKQAAERARGLDDARRRYEALADPSRIRAAAMIKRHPGLCACEVQAALGLTHATVSHHMRVLVDAGIVETERRGRWVHYALTDAGAALTP